MGNIKDGTKFNLQFNQKDPAHLHVAGLLNQQGHRNKAQYIVNAVLHYEDCGELPNAQHPVRIDEKYIEAVVARMLRGREETAPGVQAAHISEQREEEQPRFDEEIIFDDAMDALGQDGINAIADALDMFRKK